MTATNVTVLGLGAMGSGFAANLAEVGYLVTVWNRTTDVALRHAETHGTHAETSARRAVANADVVIVMVTDDDASRRIWLDPETGIAGYLKTGSIAVESSTLSPDWITDLNRTLGGHAFLEAPVVGSRPQLAARQLITLVGGDRDVLESVGPILSASSGRIEHVGPVGNAAHAKLFINALFAGQVALFAEIVAAIESSSLDQQMMTTLLTSLPITAPGLARVVGLIETRNFAPNFPISLVEKDLRYLTETGRALPMTRCAHETFNAANERGDGQLDISGVANSYLGSP